ncbi:MAG: transposase family protein [Nisaea sp.]|uniref:transposase family protein n=1 Tax=Alphaproteobacteria TaxID=28211 RepID=UPI0032677EF1
MTPAIDLVSCLAAIPDRRRAEGKMYGQVGVILFSIIAMLSGARSYRQIHALIAARLPLLNAAFPKAALRRAPAYTSVRGILRQIDPDALEVAFRRHAQELEQICAPADPSRFLALWQSHVRTLRRKPRIAQPFVDQVGIHRIPPRHMRNRNTRYTRLSTDRTLLIN